MPTPSVLRSLRIIRPPTKGTNHEPWVGPRMNINVRRLIVKANQEANVRETSKHLFYRGRVFGPRCVRVEETIDFRMKTKVRPDL